MPHAPGNGAILGVVSEDGIVKPGAPVDLYDRTTGMLVTRQFARDDGSFAFSGLNPNTSDYRVVTQDEDEPFKEALVRDRITPIPGYRGASYWNNWLRLAQLNRAVTIHTNEASPDGKLLPACAVREPPIIGVSGTMPNNAGLPAVFGPSMTPGAPQWPSVQLNNQKLIVPARSRDKLPSALVYPDTAMPTALSFETVFDFASVSAPGSSVYWLWLVLSNGYAWLNNAPQGTFTKRHPLVLQYLATKHLAVYIDDDTAVGTNRGYSASTSTLGTKLADFNLSGVSQQPHHVLVTATWAVDIKLYLDGELFDSASLTGKPAKAVRVANDSFRHAGILIETPSSTDGTFLTDALGVTVLQGPMACYPTALSDQTVADLYSALMVGSLPQVTGYAKEVFADTPVFYARLNDTPIQPGAEGIAEFTNPDANFVASYYGSGVQFNQPTIVAGGSGMRFGGAAVVKYSSTGRGIANPIGFTLSWVGRPASAAPAASEMMFANTDTSNTSTLKIERNTSGQLVLTYVVSGGTESLTFAGAPYSDTSAQHLYAVVLDKTSATATLYVDGEEACTVGTGPALLSVLSNSYPGTCYCVHIGGLYNTNATVGYGHSGLLSEVAMFAKPLSAAQIANHYSAIDVV
jgi:hypothetical protein